MSKLATLLIIANTLVGCAVDGVTEQPVDAEHDSEGTGEPLAQALLPHVKELVTTGTGCPQGSLSLMQAGELYSKFGLHDFTTSVNENSSIAVKTCNLAITLRGSPGEQFAVAQVALAGSTSLGPNVELRERVSYFFRSQPTAGVDLSNALRGPYVGATSLESAPQLQDLVWTPCGVDPTLSVTLTERMANSSRSFGSTTAGHTSIGIRFFRRGC